MKKLPSPDDKPPPRETLKFANFKVSLGGGLSSGLGNFFIGEGEGAVRIDYDINKDTVSGLIDRVNDSGANVHMYYDPVSDRFVIRNKDEGAPSSLFRITNRSLTGS